MHNRNYSYIILILLGTFSVTLQSVIDLEEYAQDFVLETKQIIIPQYPHAFNPSLIRWNNMLLMSFRVIPDPKQPFHSWIGITKLDEHLQPTGKLHQLHIRPEQSTIPSRVDDGRLITINNRLYLVYSDNEDRVISKGGFRVYIAELLWDGTTFLATNIERLSHFEGNDLSRREKNWVPFLYNNKLLLAYSLVPHRIFYPIPGTGSCETFTASQSLISWAWGELRGGTPAFIDGDHYLGFFHSSKHMVTMHSQGKEVIHYFMGAYTYSRNIPFTITQISPKPIIGKQFYHGADYKPYWGSVRVVYPGGFIFDDHFVWITYGRQDHEMWIAKLDKKKLYESLVPVSSIN